MDGLLLVSSCSRLIPLCWPSLLGCRRVWPVPGRNQVQEVQRAVGLQVQSLHEERLFLRPFGPAQVQMRHTSGSIHRPARKRTQRFLLTFPHKSMLGCRRSPWARPVLCSQHCDPPIPHTPACQCALLPRCTMRMPGAPHRPLLLERALPFFPPVNTPPRIMSSPLFAPRFSCPYDLPTRTLTPGCFLVSPRQPLLSWHAQFACPRPAPGLSRGQSPAHYSSGHTYTPQAAD